jgi:O-antigen/teichoic acid export membrane protein
MNNSEPISRRDRRLSKIIHGGLSAILGRGVGLLVSAISLPLTVRYLGPERYGIWITASTTVVMLNVIDFGIANTLTNIISRAYAADDRSAAQRFYATAFWISMALAMAIALVAALLWGHINWASALHTHDPATTREASLCVAIAFGFFLLSLPLNLIHRVLSGYQQTQITNYFNLMSNILGLGSILLVIRLHGSLPQLMFVYSSTLLASTAALNLWVVFWDKRWLLPRPAIVSRMVVSELMQSGFAFFILQLAGLVVFNSDNIVITHYLGAAEVTPYSVAWRIGGYAAILQTAVFPSLWPAYSEAYVRGEYAWVRRTFWNVARLSMGSTAAAVLIMAFFGRSLIRWYVGPAAVPSQWLLLAMCFWTLLSTGMNVEACLLAAINRVKWQSILGVIAVVLNVAFSIYLVQRVGSVGVILGTILSYLLVVVVPQTVIVLRALYQPPTHSSTQKTGNWQAAAAPAAAEKA